MSRAPIFGQTPERRRELLEPLVGRGVTVYVDTHRSGDVTPISGVLRGFSYCLSGTTRDVAVVELDPGTTIGRGYQSVAIPGAQIAGVRFAGPSPTNVVGRVPELGR